MASTTTNIGLTKPAGTDQALISAINGNMDIIDTKMGAVGNTSVQSQITSLSDQIASDSGLQYIKVDGNDSYIMYRKIGKIVMMYAHHKVSSATIAAWSNYFFTQDMPQNFRPAIDIVVPMVHDRSGGEGCAFAVNANGNVFISGRNTGATATGEILQATVTYIVA